VNHSDFKSGLEIVIKHPVPQPMRSAVLLFSSFGLLKVHFPAFEQYRREVYLLIYIDILISLHKIDADIHVSYSRLAQIIPVNENLIVPPLPSRFWTGESVSTVT
jgi:hypothetical protein